MKIDIICIGKLKETYLIDAMREYTKRLSRYCKLSIIELADERTPDNASIKEVEAIKTKEGERILSKINPTSYVITLDLFGKMLSSEEFAHFIYTRGTYGQSHFTFIIGGSLGLSQAVLKRAHFSLSFSKMTFPHQLFRILLLEQLYRGFKINSGEPYHK